MVVTEDALTQKRNKMGKKMIGDAKNFDELLDIKYEKGGTKKSYISRLENGKCDIQLSTLYRIFEFGLGKKVNLLIG